MPDAEVKAALNNFITNHQSEASAVLNALYVGVSKAEQKRLLSGIAHKYYRAKARGMFDDK
jgi:hypothetical protein